MKGKMKAAVLHQPGDLRYEEVEIPQIGDKDVLVKVTACGVCGSDIPRVMTTGTYHFPTIPGHEFGGRIVELGSKVDENLKDKKVAVIPLIPCKKCKLCEIGQFAQCEDYDFLGSRNDGGFAEYVKVPAENVVVVPDNVADEAVAFLEPISVALHVVQNCGVNFGDSVAVFGLGAIGIFVAQWAKAFGAAHVFALDVDEKKIKVAKELGLEDALCIGQENIEEIIKEKTNGVGLDVAFEASGAPAAFCQAIELLRTSGRMGLVGRPTKALALEPEIFEKILRSQLTIHGTWSFEFTSFPHHAWQQSLEALSKEEIKTKPIISHRMPLSQTFDAVKIMADKSEFFYKILIEPEM
ncbi:MAG: galactitol-1-phosphate 5-dehydrogenase [Anaerostipes sp.]|nr:galactitol-1-phosphate 5-dehydrogenase [Anaerostipes sp.]